MPSFRIPGPVCGSQMPALDEGTLVRWWTPPPQPVCMPPPATPPRQWHHFSRGGGFNIGHTGFRDSSVATLVNNPQAKTGHATLEDAWKAWNKSQGKLNKGLVNRRAAEWRIYTGADYARW